MPAASDLDLRLSGGGGNTNVNASLGGAMSSQALQSQQATFTTSIAGITVLYAGGLTAGTCNLRFVASGDLLSLLDPSDGTTYGPTVAVGSNGTYLIQGATRGCVLVQVVAASTPTSGTSTGVFTVTNQMNNLFDNIQGSEARLGRVEYRCVYVGNQNVADAISGAGVFIRSQPTGGDLLAVGLDPVGKGDGVATGVAQVITDEATAPTGVTFSTPTAEDSPLAIPGGLAAEEYQAVWIRRTVPPNTTGNFQADTSVLGFTMVF